ncbi:MAG: hypothetical protein Edafosvirus1_99 [Edafosvirus sp.]|uniref:Uncharacterized protein n=1 Tax=Edafosvirus sp. TaxID=2487765 RepID=A0A3G4ZSA0_9VIRU|nr:MAG: hypothetical protein Edafosvirus1_99 [Edafosvirus sp.]
MVDKIQSVNTYLSAKSTATSLGFIAGFCWKNQDTKNVLERPLSSTFDGSLNGMFYAWCTGIVYDYTPKDLKWITSTALIGAIGYDLVKRIKKNYDDTTSIPPAI